MNFLKHSVDCALENQWHSRHVELPCQANCRCYCNIAMMFTLSLASQFTGEQILMWNNENTLLLFFSLQATAKGFVLIQTKEVTMRPEDVKRVFQNDAEDLVEWITKGGRSSLLVSNRKRKKS